MPELQSHLTHFDHEVTQDHHVERRLLYREMIVLLALALFVAVRSAIL